MRVIKNVLKQSKTFNPFKRLKIKKKIMRLFDVLNDENVIAYLNCCSETIDYNSIKIPNPVNCFYK